MLLNIITVNESLYAQNGFNFFGFLPIWIELDMYLMSIQVLIDTFPFLYSSL